MDDTANTLSGPDLAMGIALSTLADGAMVQGHAHGEPVLLAIGAFCTHYGAPLVDGLLVGDTVRCPWHHACFSLRTGEALRPPALDAVPGWRVEQRDGSAYVAEKLDGVGPPLAQAQGGLPGSVVIVGGGAAGNAAAETLRREGYSGGITMLSADASGPCDRPNLSKGYLAGSAPAESNPLRSPESFEKHHIDLTLGARVTSIDTASRQVHLVDGTRHAYDALLLATGAEPVRLNVPGADLPHVYYLRTDVGTFIRKLHEQHGVTFHLGTTAASIDERGVTLHNGDYLPADLVVVGIGVRPAISLAEQLTGERIRVEHWVVAERQGQTAARNILGRRERFDAVPFFWTEQYDFGLAYVGHAERWDKAELDGQLDADTRNCTITYSRGGRRLAVAVVHRDLEGLRAEAEFERATRGDTF